MGRGAVGGGAGAGLGGGVLVGFRGGGEVQGAGQPDGAEGGAGGDEVHLVFVGAGEEGDGRRLLPGTAETMWLDECWQLFGLNAVRVIDNARSVCVRAAHTQAQILIVILISRWNRRAFDQLHLY